MITRIIIHKEARLDFEIIIIFIVSQRVGMVKEIHHSKKEYVIISLLVGGGELGLIIYEKFTLFKNLVYLRN